MPRLGEVRKSHGARSLASRLASFCDSGTPVLVSLQYPMLRGVACMGQCVLKAGIEGLGRVKRKDGVLVV